MCRECIRLPENRDKVSLNGDSQRLHLLSGIDGLLLGGDVAASRMGIEYPVNCRRCAF